MNGVMRGLLAVTATIPAALAYAAAIGLGLHRHGQPFAVSAAATMIVFLPPLGMAVAANKNRSNVFFGSLLAWSLIGLLVMPIYFPGQRRDAVNSGLALFLGTAGRDDVAASIADSLPEELPLAEPELEAAQEARAEVLPPPRMVAAHEIVLPYEGEGRNLSIPVVFEHRGTELELNMMLDTGATYTTLSLADLERLGIRTSSDDPTLTLHTANGERQANILLLDRVWLGDLPVDGVAIATCDACSSRATAGLLGLNVSGGFNTTIDADRREVVFSRRNSFDRKLDVKPFLDLQASFARYPGGRVEVDLSVDNRADRTVTDASAEVRCGERTWSVKLGQVDPGEVVDTRRKLPTHEACEAYRIDLHDASW